MKLKYIKKRKSVLYSLSLLFISVSCVEISQRERELTEVLNKSVQVEMLQTIHQGNNTLSFSDLKQRYKYISIVYLKDGCSPCYPKFTEWLNKINLVRRPENYAVLFVIHAASFNAFFRESSDFEKLTGCYFAFLDMENLFFNSNSDIPDWIYESSFLINDKQEIKMVGPPFFNNDFTAVFHKVVNFQN